MSGAGFLAGTTSPASTSKPAASRSPTTCSSTARTDSSAEVEATASCHPAVLASCDDALDPGPAGKRAGLHELLVVRRLALVPIGEQLALALGIGGQAVRPATNSGVSRLAIRSLPPPIRSFSAYSSGDQRTGSPTSSNVWLKAGR